MIQKRILVPDRVRRLPRTDWAWVDRRFLRDFAPKLSGDAVFLYYLLIAVSDKNGLSFYGDNSLAQMIRTPQGRLLQARQELVDWNLIAYDSPLTQVLALPSLKATQPESKATPDNYQQLLAMLAASTSVKESTQ